MARILLPVLLVSLLTAGCFGSETPAADAPVASAEADGAAPSTNSTATPAGPGADNATDDAAAPPEPRTVTVSESGDFGPGLDVCRSEPNSVSCAGLGSARWITEVALGGGNATAYSFTVTYSATLPVSLVASVSACSEEGCDHELVSGPSPLVIESTGSWTSIYVAVSPEPLGAAGVGVYAALPQTFTVEGTATVEG